MLLVQVVFRLIGSLVVLINHIVGCATIHMLCALVQGWRPDWREVIRLSLNLASAVAAIHKAGILHRDIKASNVLLGAPHHHKCTRNTCR